MKIKQLNIENFRCFKGENSFNIDEKTIILYGENGYGKSSFFDAIEWCLTGNVDRFSQTIDKALNKSIILNRSAEVGETCSVEINIDNFLLKRSFKNIDKPREVVYIKDSTTKKVLAQNRDSVEKFIAEHLAERTVNKKLLSSLIKKSHLLSQDQITDFVLRDNPKGRFDSLADIMGYRQLMNLGENLKRINDSLKRTIKQENDSIKTYSNILNEKKQEKVEVDVLRLNTLIQELKIDINDPSGFDEIGKRENSLVREEVRINEKISTLNKVNSEMKMLSYEDIKAKLLFSKKSLQIESIRKKKIDRILDKISRDIKQVEKGLSAVDSQSRLLKDKKELEKKINELRIYLKDNGINSEEEIEYLIIQVEKRQKELIYAQSHIQNYKKYVSKQELIPNLLISKKIELGKYSKRLKNIEKYQGIFQALLEEEKGATSLVNLNNAIQDIYKYINAENLQICPVCSSNPNEDLKNKVLENINSNMNEIAMMSSKINKVNNKIKYTKKKIQIVKNEKMTLENKINNLEAELLLSDQSLLEIKKNKLFNLSLFEKEYNEIDGMLKISSEEISTLNNHRVKYHTFKSYLQQLSNLSKQEILNDEVRNTKLNSRKSTLLNRESKLRKFLGDVKQKVIVQEQENELLNKVSLLLSNILEQNEKDIPIDNVSNKYYDSIVGIKLELKKIRDASDLLEKVKENTKIEKNVQHYENIILEKQKKVEVYDNESLHISTHRTSIYSQIGDKASDLLNKPDSSIQKYFRYLNPVPSVNKVLFNSPSPEELEIILSYTNDQESTGSQSNVQYSLSSGQLYVLAISIFLAINEAQNVSKFSFIGIDDPIQNMDDVNQFSICDVLSSLNKQLIFSTHDFEFLKLYLKKNEHKKEHIQVFMFEQTDDSRTSIKKLIFN